MGFEDVREQGRRLVSCPGFRWKPGMLARSGLDPAKSWRLTEEDLRTVHHRWWLVEDQAWPDLRDPATWGWLIFLLEESSTVAETPLGCYPSNWELTRRVVDHFVGVRDKHESP